MFISQQNYFSSKHALIVYIILQQFHIYTIFNVFKYILDD